MYHKLFASLPGLKSIKSLENRVILKFYYEYNMKNNVKKGQNVLSQLVLYSILLSVNVYFETKMMVIDMYAPHLQLVK